MIEVPRSTKRRPTPVGAQAWGVLLVVLVTLGTGVAQAALPDHRAYEMVSPASKGGGDVMGDPGKTRAALSGDAVGFSSLQAFGDAYGTGIAVDYLAERTAIPGTNGWTTHALTPTQDSQSALFAIPGGVQSPFYVGEYSDDLTAGIFRSLSPLTPAPNVATTRNLYLRTDLRANGPGTYRLLTDSTVPLPSPCFAGCANTIFYKPWLAAASSDLTHIVFESSLNLLPGTGTSYPKLYEWVNGTLRLAGILPDGSVAMCDATNACAIAGHGASRRNYTTNTISADGSSVFFTTPVGGNGAETSGSSVYMRDDHGTASVLDDTTVQLNKSENPVPDAPGGAVFLAATPDGSHIYFSSPEQLTANSGSGLYSYDATKPDSAPDNLTLLANGEIEGLIGTSINGDTVYFMSTSELLSGQPTVSQGVYIYRWHRGTLQYVGALTSANDTDPNLGQQYLLRGSKTSRVSSDGRFLLFQASSGDGLTGYHHANDCNIAGDPRPSDMPCTELYVYDAEGNGGAGALACISCLSSGALSAVAASAEFAVGTAVSGVSSHLNHPMSTDGRRVFFATGSPLVPDDRNGRVVDVYEYDTSTQALHLLSSGRGTSPSYFLDASPDGSNAFFITRVRLVGWDRDDNYDLYDARINGGFPDPSASRPACLGDSCQPAPTAPPHSDAAGSITFDTGDLTKTTVPILRLHKPDPSSLRRWAITGRLVVTLRSSTPGALSIKVRAFINHHLRTVAATLGITAHTGVTRLTLALSPLAQHYLRHHALPITLTATISGNPTPQRTKLTIKRAVHA